MANNALIARLIGHAFADGHIHKTKRYFIYVNSNKRMHEHVCSMVRQAFGNVTISKGASISGTPRYQYSNIVGIEMSKHGAPVGSKVLNKTRIPDWISYGPADVKSAFLSALFDDEGYFRDTPTSRQIVFKAAKSLALKGNLEEYLQQIISMLDAFGIKTSGIKSDQIKRTKNGTQMISLRFWITSNKNFQMFKEHLQLLHPEKSQKLNNILSGSR